jgi:hypothetical protein
LKDRLTLPERNTVVRDQLVIHADFPLSSHHRLFEELTAQRADICRRLALPTSDEPIDIYLFETPEQFQGFMQLHYPGFPDRRAFFVETDAKLTIYAQWGDRMAMDLRHEVTHAYLHAVAPTIPLWIDEGIAKYFEVARGRCGLNRKMLDRLNTRIAQEHWQPELRRLEQFPTKYCMTLDDYAEAWAWVHFLLESRPEYAEILRAYLADLRRDGTSAPISVRLAPILSLPTPALLDHLARIEKDK